MAGERSRTTHEADSLEPTGRTVGGAFEAEPGDPPDAARLWWQKRWVWVALVWALVGGYNVHNSLDTARRVHVDYFFWRKAAEEFRHYGEVDRYHEISWYLPVTTYMLTAWVGWFPTPDTSVPPRIDAALDEYWEKITTRHAPDAEGRLPAAGVNPYSKWRRKHVYPRDDADRAVGVLFVLSNVFLCAWLLVEVTRFVGFRGRWWWAAQIVPVLLLEPYIGSQFKRTQLTFLILVLLLLGLRQLERQRPVRAGIVFGLATILKIQPFVFFVWLAFKRQWRAIGAGAGVVVAMVALDLAVLGPAETAKQYERWWDAARRGTAEHFVRAEEECDERNGGLAVTLRRFLHPTNCARTVTGEPHHSRPAEEQFQINFAEWDLDSILLLYQVIVVGSILLGIWVVRRPWDELTVVQRRAEFALFLLGILWVVPLLRWYYGPFCLPAIALVWSDHRWRRRSPLVPWTIGLLGLAALAMQFRESWAYSPLIWSVPLLALHLLRIRARP